MSTRLEDRPGVVAIIVSGGDRVAIAECARCGRVRPLPSRGLCIACKWDCRRHGTTGEYGWTKTDRKQEFAAARKRGLSVIDAAAEAGVCKRTGERYESELRNSEAA